MESTALLVQTSESLQQTQSKHARQSRLGSAAVQGMAQREPLHIPLQVDTHLCEEISGSVKAGLSSSVKDRGVIVKLLG